MKYVVDASVTLRVVLQNALTPKAVQLLDDYRNHIHDLTAPSVFPGELASALTKAERQKLIAVGDARKLLTDLLLEPPRLVPYEPILYRATDISSLTRCGLYDALYTALAERENCELVTADDKFLRNVQGKFPFVISLAQFP